MAATERTPPGRRSRWLRHLLAVARKLPGLLGGLAALGPAKAVDLGPDRAELMYHRYEGGGLSASGPAVLVRKTVVDNLAVTGSVYVDAVSSASIDVVTSASRYTERRTEYALSAEHVHRDTRMTVSGSTSREPDYVAKRLGLDLAQDVFGGMSTVSMGFTRGNDDVGKHNEPSFAQTADHWQYRAGASLILSPRWIASFNGEALADEGYLGSPYRVAYVFGAAVPERVPGTRSARALKLRVAGDLGSRNAIQAGYRYYWDSWGIAARTLDLNYSQHVGDDWLLDGSVRWHSQHKAVFYSNDSQAETRYITRNRQLGSFHDLTLGVKGAYTLRQAVAGHDLSLNAALERVRYRFSDFTDLRTGKLYRYDANVLQLFVSANF